MYEKFLNKKVEVVQKDGFAKHGILTGETDEFLEVVYYDGRTTMIRKDFINRVETEEVEE